MTPIKLHSVLEKGSTRAPNRFHTGSKRVSYGLQKGSKDLERLRKRAVVHCQVAVQARRQYTTYVLFLVIFGHFWPISPEMHKAEKSVSVFPKQNPGTIFFNFF